MPIADNLDNALAPIVDGCVLAVPRESAGVPMAATRALIRRGVKRLHLIALPTSTLQADLLIGAGCAHGVVHWFRKARAMSRASSRSRIVSRLSCNFLPLPSPSRTFACDPLK